MCFLPRYFLSLRQPWAWLVIHGDKIIENRSWRTSFRGRIGIHAAKGCTRDEYDACQIFVRGFNPQVADCIPAFSALQRGGIVGACSIADCVTSDPSPWFCGPYGFIIHRATAVDFVACRGALGFFRLESINGVLSPLWGRKWRVS